MFDKNQLAHFIGTERYHRSTFGKLHLTDGVFYIYQNGAAWLVDLIESYQRGKVQNTPFQMWELQKTGTMAVITMKEDSNEPVMVKQEIPYTDFPIDYFKLYVIDGVCLLTSEY